mgnify:CR=1 FL=1
MIAGIVSHPHFISLEGGDGAGKSSALAVIRQTLADRGLDVLSTREPGGTPVAERIRELLLTRGEEVEPLAPKAELLLMFAARVQHVHAVIRPALREGRWVVSDRFTDSSYAYQVAGRGLEAALVERLEHETVGLKPGLTLLLDLDVRVGRARASGRDLWPDRIEREQDDFFERVREGFLQRAAADPARFRVIDAGRGLDEVAAAVRATVERHLEALA